MEIWRCKGRNLDYHLLGIFASVHLAVVMFVNHLGYMGNYELHVLIKLDQVTLDISLQ